MKAFVSNFEAVIAVVRGHFRLRGRTISITLAILGAVWQWPLQAQTNVSLELVSRWPPSGGRMVRSVSVVGNYAFVGDSAGLEILDLSNPANPTLLGGAPTPGSAYGVQVVGSNAFVSVYGGDVSVGGGLQIIDVSNPQLPERIGGVAKGDTYELQVVNQYAYVADFYRGLEIYDVTNPTNPVVVAGYNPGGNPIGIRVLGSFAYLAAYSGGLKIVNIANPAQPVLAGSFSNIGEIWDVDVAGNHAFLANHYNGVNVIVISDPAQPRLIANLPTKGYPTSVRAVGSRVFVTASEDGLRVMDVGNPAQPVLVGSFRLSGSTRAVDVIGPYAYVAGFEEGLVILRITERPLGISEQPIPLRVETGQTAVFSASAVSVASFTYQWQMDGTDLQDNGRISGTKTSILSIANISTNDRACYSLVVSNNYGSIASSNACLTVVPGLREALDDTNLVWSTSGSSPWKLQFAVIHDGLDAAEGGPLQAGVIGQQNMIGTSVTGPGTINFWWKMEDTLCFALSFFIGTDRLASKGPWTSESTNWEQRVFSIPDGPQTLKWVFETFCGDGSPPGRAWLDEVTYIPDSTPLITEQPRDLQIRMGQDAMLTFTATGTEPLFNQWFIGQAGDTNHPISGATNRIYIVANLVSNATYWVHVTNALGAAESRTATVTIGNAMAVLTHNTDSLSIEVTGLTGSRVEIQFSTNLLDWASLPLPTLTLSDSRNVLQIPKSNSMAFYRLVTVP